MNSHALPHRALPLALLLAGLVLPAPAAAQQYREMTAARQRWSEDSLNVELHYSAGRLRVKPASDPALYRIDLKYEPSRYTPVTHFDREQSSLVFDLQSRSRTERIKNVNGEASAIIALAPAIPLRLDLNFGAGSAELDLGGMALRELNLSTGASETHVSFDNPNRITADRVTFEAGAAELSVTRLGNARAKHIAYQGGVGSTTLEFGGEWRNSATASLSMGIGELVLKLPRSLGVRIDKDSFLTSFEAPGMVKRGNSYFSPAWDGAEYRVTIDIDAAIGEIRVEWLD